ncbi:MAG: hypothetical protein ACERIH_10450 [Labilibaculum antarcticum]
MLSSALDGFDTSKPLSIPMGPLSPINDLAGVLIQQYVDDIEETLEMAVQLELAEAKEEGLKGVKSFVYNNSNSKKDKYDLIDISAETASKLLQGEFKTMSKLKEFDSEIESFDKPISILFRSVKNSNRGGDFMQVIESIFLKQ